MLYLYRTDLTEMFNYLFCLSEDLCQKLIAAWIHLFFELIKCQTP